MKNSILFYVFGLILIQSCKTPISEEKHTIVFGKFTNSNSESIQILNTHYDTLLTINLDSEHSFKDTLKLTPGIYRLNINDNSTQIYLDSNTHLYLTADVNKFTETIKSTGNGSKDNNYLFQKQRLHNKLGKLNYYGHYGSLNESDFINLTDSINLLHQNHLENSDSLSGIFRFKENKQLHYQKLKKYYEYPLFHRMLTGNKAFEVSKNYPKPLVSLDLNDNISIESPEYLTLLRYSIFKNRSKPDSNANKSLVYLDNIITQISNPDIKQELIYKFGRNSLKSSLYLDTIYNKIMEKINNPSYSKIIKQKYRVLTELKKGMPSPDFEFENENGEKISLNKLDGKLFYIDVWATWCAPCLKEIPHLNSLIDRYKNNDIQFISICAESKLEDWQKTIEEKQIQGLQLFATNTNNPFFNNYKITGYPRYILLDNKKNIINAFTKRPSDKAIFGILDGLLDE